jgi:hypothetical protein
VFIEVKTKIGSEYGMPEEMVSKSKNTIKGIAMSNVTTKTIIKLLNELILADRKAINELVNLRVQVNEEVQNSSSFITSTNGKIGVVGLLNSILVASKETKIFAMFAADGTLLSFYYLDEYGNERTS